MKLSKTLASIATLAEEGVSLIFEWDGKSQIRIAHLSADLTEKEYFQLAGALEERLGESHNAYVSRLMMSGEVAPEQCPDCLSDNYSRDRESDRFTCDDCGASF